MKRLDYFFKPNTIAIIGASDRFYSWGNWIGEHLIKYKTKGNVYLVNPRHDKVLGEKTYKDISNIPENIDLALVIVPANEVISTLEQCADKDAKVATIISAGFSETTEGKNLGLELKRIVREYGIRVQGPNCAGFYNNLTGINASPLDEKFMQKSPVVFITQSGFVGNTLSIWAPTRNLPIGAYISVGNEADLTVTDYVEYFGDDPEVQSMLLYIEGIRNGTRFQDVVKKVASKKPLVVWKTSETKDVKRAALSHTAHLVGSEQVFQGLLKQLGVIRIRRLEYGLKVCHSFLRHPPLKGDRIAITMVGAGWGIILTDTLSQAGFRIPEPSEKLKIEFKKILPSYRVSVRNPIDFGAADTMDFRLMKKIIQVGFESGEIDAFIIANIGEFSPFNEEATFLEVQIANSIRRLEKKYQKPIYLFTLLDEVDSKSVPMIKKKKMNMYHSMDELLEVLKAQYYYYGWKRNSII